jgi:hypothetical protein
VASHDGRSRAKLNVDADDQGRIAVNRDKLLSIYLNDHLAGSTLGLELAKRSRASNQGTPLADFLDRLVREIETDRETLKRLMRELGIRPDPLKTCGAWVAEKLGRLKLNGQITGYSPLSRVVELESLYLGVTGKLEMWIALERALANDAVGVEFGELRRRAERQAAEVEEHRLDTAEAVLAAPGRNS